MVDDDDEAVAGHELPAHPLLPVSVGAVVRLMTGEQQEALLSPSLQLRAGDHQLSEDHVCPQPSDSVVPHRQVGHRLDGKSIAQP